MVLYIIKGFHYSTFIPNFYNANNGLTKKVKIRFDKSCVYNIDEKSCVNKLWGFSVGLFGVHKNSYRFGWTYENDKIIIWSYCYINGKLHKKQLTECEFDKEYECSIEIYDKATLIFNGVKIEFPVYESGLLMELGFYFGGETRCPNNMKINFNRIK
jgi:hypothetical protein